MTPQEAKELLPIIEAYANGETIQLANKGQSDWLDMDNLNFDATETMSYRIKPKPRLVEMTHEDLPPVFWVRRLGTQCCSLATEIDSDGNIYTSSGQIDPEDGEWSTDRKTWNEFTKEVTE